MTIKRMDITEFRTSGFLQEANRQFFHPLGLALEIVIDDDGNERLGGVWDYRDDPEGMVFADLSDADSLTKSEIVAAEGARHSDDRQAEFGWVVQPIGDQRL